MKLKSLLLLSILSLFSFTATAGIHVEPYIGYTNFTTTFEASKDLKVSAKGLTTVGGRLGYSLLLFSAGVDYQLDKSSDHNRKNISAFVGVDFPILVRGYLKYVISSDYDNDDLPSGAGDITFKNGYAVGLGFTGLPFVSVNVEVEKSSYTAEDLPIVGDTDFDWASVMLSVSLPLDL